METNLEKRNRMEKEARERESKRTSKPSAQVEMKDAPVQAARSALDSIPLGQRAQYSAFLRDYEARKASGEPVGDSAHQYAMDRLH